MSLRVAVVFHRLGPYHHARLNAAAALGAITGVELSSVDETYAWAPVQGGEQFVRVTLFTGRDAVHHAARDLTEHLANALTAASPNVVAVPGWGGLGAAAALEWCRRTHTPAVLMSESAEGDAPRVWWRESVKRRVVAMCSAALVGGTLHRVYLERLGFPGTHIFTGYDVVDNAHFCAGADCARKESPALRGRLGLPERYFLASNRFVNKKNVPTLLHAYAAYRAARGSDAWSLVLLGDGPERAGLETLRERLRLGEAVIMPGFRQYSQLPLYYGLAGAFVHASTSEQWGLVVNEAAAAGLPLLVSRKCGCAPDLIQEGVNGFTFDPNDVAALAELLAQVAHGSDLERMGRASRDVVAAWSPETFGRNLLQAAEIAVEVGPPRSKSLNGLLLWGLARR